MQNQTGKCECSYYNYQLLLEDAENRNFDHVEFLGKGGQGLVVLLTSPTQNSRVVKMMTIKLVDPCTGQMQDNTEYIERELFISAKFKHPNVAKLISRKNCECGNHVLATFPYRGISLKTWKEKQASMGNIISEEKIQSILRQLVSCGFKLHDWLVTHLDENPQNILICEKDGMITLIDFGLAFFHHEKRMMDERKKGLDVKAAEDQYLCFGLRGTLGNDFCAAELEYAYDKREPLIFSATKADVAAIGKIAKFLSSGSTRSKDLQEFIDYATARDPKQRPSMLDLANHPYLNEGYASRPLEHESFNYSLDPFFRYCNGFHGPKRRESKVRIDPYYYKKINRKVNSILIGPRRMEQCPEEFIMKEQKTLEKDCEKRKLYVSLFHEHAYSMPEHIKKGILDLLSMRTPIIMQLPNKRIRYTDCETQIHVAKRGRKLGIDIPNQLTILNHHQEQDADYAELQTILPNPVSYQASTDDRDSASPSRSDQGRGFFGRLLERAKVAFSRIILLFRRAL